MPSRSRRIQIATILSGAPFWPGCTSIRVSVNLISFSALNKYYYPLFVKSIYLKIKLQKTWVRLGFGLLKQYFIELVQEFQNSDLIQTDYRISINGIYLPIDPLTVNNISEGFIIYEKLLFPSNES